MMSKHLLTSVYHKSEAASQGRRSWGAIEKCAFTYFYLLKKIGFNLACF